MEAYKFLHYYSDGKNFTVIYFDGWVYTQATFTNVNGMSLFISGANIARCVTTGNWCVNALN